ncbi:MAG TPA: hypothetical protein VM901_06780 [Bdellovibrionota bacterium]|nr:hypothetical protein [Bdellovibrionota bacterium]
MNSKTKLRLFSGLAVIGLSASANALEWQCGKSLEVLGTTDSQEQRPHLVVKTIVRDDGTVVKKYKPLAAANEAVGDYLMSVKETTKVCVKYYDPILPAPVPLLILDISTDNP